VIDNNIGKFVSKYNASWIEDRKQCSAKLEIAYKRYSKRRLYILIWDLENGHYYTGRGVLCDNILIGNFQSALYEDTQKKGINRC
jgi:hypothetical protein